MRSLTGGRWMLREVNVSRDLPVLSGRASLTRFEMVLYAVELPSKTSSDVGTFRCALRRHQAGLVVPFKVFTSTQFVGRKLDGGAHFIDGDRLAGRE